jgi:hypothetical protein
MIAQRVIIIAILAFGVDSAFACSCIGEESVQQARKRADAVVVGTVVAVERLEVSYPGLLTHFPIYANRYTVLVEHTFKGRNAADTIIIVTGQGGGDCGYQFEVSKRYVIYGSRDNGAGESPWAEKPVTGRGIYWTSICTRTRAYDESEIKELEALK